MSVAVYAEYKESGAIWLGAVPAHWDVAPLKYLTTLRSGGTPSKDREDYWLGDIPWASAKDLKSDSISDTIDHISTVALDESAASLTPPGSILVLVRGMMLARAFPVVQTEAPMAFNQDLKALTPIDGIAAAYLAWALKATAQESMDRCEEAGHGTKALRMDAWLSMSLPRPTPSEQTAIASFLDRETGKIDALVEEQRRLIAMLKEKRQAVISHAVTKGLDPNAPMKDCGIEWLGEVPAHWSVAPLKRDLAFLTSGSRGWAEHYADDGALFIRIGNLTRDNIDLDLSDIHRVAAPAGSEGERTGVVQGDVLFSITAYLGSVAVIAEPIEQAFVSQHIALVRIAGNLMLPKWLAYVALSKVGKSYLDLQAYGGTKIQLSLGDVAGLVVPLPPKDEQSEIIRYVEAAVKRMDGLVAQAEAATVLLQERRAALISAVVTGKIDVRGLVTAVTAQEAA